MKLCRKARGIWVPPEPVLKDELIAYVSAASTPSMEIRKKCRIQRLNELIEAPQVSAGEMCPQLCPSGFDDRLAAAIIHGTSEEISTSVVQWMQVLTRRVSDAVPFTKIDL